jgi:methionyl-tRNA formyltransferase
LTALRTVVCAYGEVGWACLDELIALGADLPLVVTHRNAPGETVWFRSVDERARVAGIRSIAPDDINAPDVVEEITAVRPELLFSFYFRNMISPRVLDLPTLGALNMHGSLLPKYRGRAPVNWVLVHGESETGVTLHYMDAKPDHGDIVAQQRVPITRDDTALSLTHKVAAAAREVLRASYPLLLTGDAPRVPQEHGSSSYFGGRKPADGEIDWRSDAESIRNLVRAVTTPWPGAFTSFRGKKLFVWRAECRKLDTYARPPGEVLVAPDGAVLVSTGANALELVEVGGEDGLRESGAAWRRRESVAAGERFASR